ncbi:MAG: hypothetical protein WEB85_00715 [Dongiaceae bacterium]
MLEVIMAHYRNKFKRRYVRADAAFANPTASCGAFTPKIFRG